MIFGTFDGIHPGHLHMINQAKALGDELTVIISRDETVMKVKGHAPVNSVMKRLSDMNAVEAVNQVILGNLGDKYKVIEKIDPDIIALGYDQAFFTEDLKSELSSRGLKAKIVRLEAFQPEIYKSSLLRKQS